MDLIGEFHPASNKGNRYALTAVCMLTGFTFCIPLKSEHAEDVIKAYIDHICCSFRPSRKILTDNWNQIQKQVMDRGIQEIENRTKIQTHLLTTVQRQNQRIPQVPQSNNSKTTRNSHQMG